MTGGALLEAWPALLAGVGIGGAAAFLGSLMLSRRMALVAGPLGHLTLPGVALALLWGFDVTLGAFPVVLLGVIVIWALERRTRLPMEALTALVFASGLAISFLVLPVAQAEAALIGDVAATTPRAALGTALACAAVAAAVQRTYPRLVLANISEELATAEGVDVRRLDLLYLLLIAVVVALGVRVVGGLLTAALVAIPPAAARNVARSLRQYRLGSAVIGALAAATGVLLAVATGWPAGPLVILASAAAFALTLPFTRTRPHALR